MRLENRTKHLAARWRRCDLSSGSSADFDRLVVAHEQIQQRKEQAGNANDTECCLPAEARGNHATENDAKYRADRGEGVESTKQSSAHALRKVRCHHRSADRAIAGLTEANDSARNEQLPIALREHAGDAGNAPKHSHRYDTLHPADAIRDPCDRNAEYGNRNGNDRDEQTELLVR